MPNETIPEKFRTVSNFSKLVFIKSIRPDLYVEIVKWFISEEIGEYFIQNLIITMEDSYVETEANTPLIFVLSPGDDP